LLAQLHAGVVAPQENLHGRRQDRSFEGPCKGGKKVSRTWATTTVGTWVPAAIGTDAHAGVQELAARGWQRSRPGAPRQAAQVAKEEGSPGCAFTTDPDELVRRPELDLSRHTSSSGSHARPGAGRHRAGQHVVIEKRWP
jgi:hypothetical protein